MLIRQFAGWAFLFFPHKVIKKRLWSETDENMY